MIQWIAYLLLFIYGAGALYYFIASTLFMARRQRNTEVSLLVDGLARIVMVLGTSLFWPINKNWK